MDKEPKFNEKETLEEIRARAKKTAEESMKNATVVDVEELAEAETRKAADAYMTESKEGMKGVKGFFKKIWKHTYFDEYYRQRQVGRARKQINETGDIYAGRKDKTPDKSTHEEAMKAVVDRFSSEYEETLSKGEEKKVLAENPETKKIKDDLKKIVTDYADGAIDESVFKTEKNRIIDSINGEEGKKDAHMRADNFFEIAQKARIAVEHGVKMEELDFDFNITIGKAKSSLKTEAHLNWIDKGIDKMKKTKIGRFISPAVLATATGLAYCILINTSKKLASSRAAQLATLGGAAVVSGAFAGMNESQRLAREKEQHNLEMAEGGTFKEGDKRREQMDRFRYEMQSSSELGEELRTLMFEKDKDGKDVVRKDIREEELGKIFGNLANIDARKSLNEEKRVDLISYSNYGNVEKERTDLEILVAKAKCELRKRLAGDLKDGIPDGKTFDTYLGEIVESQKDALLGGEKGMSAQDKAFRKYKAGRVAKKVALTIGMGLVIGGGIQEIKSLFDEHSQGIVEGIMGHHNVNADTQTPLEHLRGWITGHPSHIGMGNAVTEHFGSHNIKLPEGTSMVQNSDGTFNIVHGDHVISNHIPLKFNADGGLDQHSLELLGKDGIVGNTTHEVVNGTKEVIVPGDNYVNNHLDHTQQINRDLWYDNDTPKPVFDQNELKLWLGGESNTGLDANGNYVMNVSHMTEGGSFHDNLSVDAQEKINNGGLKLLLSLTQGSQNHVFEVPIDANGNAVIDPNSEIGKLFFGTDASGHTIFKGRFAEVAETFGKGDNGSEHVKILSTFEGPGNDAVKDIISTHEDIAINNLDLPLSTESPYFIPVLSRAPLESIEYGKGKPILGQGLNEKEEKDKTATPQDKIKDIQKDNTVVEYGPMDDSKVENKIQTPEQKGVSQEEYDAMKDDMVMLNKKRQSQDGIATISENDFKSEYGKKRYNDLKHIGEGIPVTFNHEELLVIGDEIETILRNTKITKENDIENSETPTTLTSIESEKEKLDKKINEFRGELAVASQNKEKVFTEFEDFVKNNLGGTIPKELEEKYSKAEKYFNEVKNGSIEIEAAFKKEREAFSQFEDFVNNSPEVPIPETLEKRYRKAEERLAKAEKEWERILSEKEGVVGATTLVETNGETTQEAETEIKKDEEKISTEVAKNEQKTQNTESSPINESKIIENPKPKTESEQPEQLSHESLSPSIQNTPVDYEKIFTAKDLSKPGTEFEFESGSFKVTKLSGGFFSRKKVEGIFKDKKNDKETLLSYSKKDLEREFEKGNIKITKTGN